MWSVMATRMLAKKSNFREIHLEKPARLRVGFFDSPAR
jgi:hypothetical protein